MMHRFYQGLKTFLILLLCLESFLLCTSISSKISLRVCNGPSCNNHSFGSDAIYSKLSTLIQQTEAKSLIEVEYGDCMNACKRSCNVGVYVNNERVKISGMTAIEASKPCFSRITTSKDIERIISLSVDHISSGINN